MLKCIKEEFWRKHCYLCKDNTIVRFYRTKSWHRFFG